MTRERIEDFREIVLPFLSRTLLKNNYENMGKSVAEEFEKDFNEILDLAIKALEQEPRWIPVSERLPEEDGEYLVTIYDTDENYKYMDIAELTDGIWQYKDYIKVLAWIPLPEPYSEVEE